MNQKRPSEYRILAIEPSSKGVGFAVLEGQKNLVGLGVKSIKKDKNAQSLLKLNELIKDYRPEILILENYSAKGSRRWPRVRKLGLEILVLARSHKLKVRLFSREEVMRTFFADAKEGTDHARAKIIAERFPEELASQLPPKRQAWDSEDSQMPVFDAVALAMTFRMRNGEKYEKGTHPAQL